MNQQNHMLTRIESAYKLIDIAKVNIKEAKGRLALSKCPGKNILNLTSDLLSIKQSGIQVIVCLLEWSEMKLLHITDYPQKAQELGLLFYHLPIKDMGVPRQNDINSLIPILVNHLANGYNILVHCKNGYGRSGIICACCLGHFGFKGDKAMEIVRKKRPGAICSREQETCIINYCLQYTET